ncbi:hypothetical protein HID58_048655 [Brassica napus]|uniref:Uncharacterized protein n=3 Tax=Brassica TaxID=3705 RepID=A0ABQ8B2S6_BRANA|nr:hypothetical protein HID58_048655 [Brassica napus]
MNVRGNIPTKFSLGIFRGHFRQNNGPRNFLGNLFSRNSVGKFRGISEERRNSEELFPTTCFVGMSDVTVYLSLWDEATSTFSGLLKRGDKSQSVMLVVTTVNPKLFGGNLYLTSTPGDMFVFDTSLSEITKFAENGGEENLPSCLEELTEKEFVFQIRVTPLNFTPNHPDVHVSHKHCENILPNSKVDVGLEASPSGRLFWVRMSGRNVLQLILHRFQPLRTTASAAVREWNDLFLSARQPFCLCILKKTTITFVFHVKL